MSAPACASDEDARAPLVDDHVHMALLTGPGLPQALTAGARLGRQRRGAGKDGDTDDSSKVTGPGPHPPQVEETTWTAPP
jgi:hypothetical protein